MAAQDPIEVWDAYRKTLRLDPIAGGDPLPKRTRFTHLIEGEDVVGLCRHTGTPIEREKIAAIEKVSRDDTPVRS